MPTVDEVLNAAEGLIGSNDLDRAGQLIAKILEFDPNQMRALLLFVTIAIARGQEETSLDAMDRLVALRPDDPQFRAVRATARRKAGDPAGAADDLLTAARHQTMIAGHWTGLAELGGGLPCAIRSIALQPNNGVGWTALFGLAKKHRWHRLAGRSAGLAAALLPDAVTFSNLAVAAEVQDKMRHAHHAGDLAIAMAPANALLYSNAAAASKVDGRLDRSLALAQRGHDLDPQSPLLTSAMAGALLQRGRIAEACTAYEMGLAKAPWDRFMAGNQVFALTYRDDLTLADRDKAIGKTMAPFDRPLDRLVPAAADPERRLTLVYVSADLRDHPIGRNMLPVFGHHDRDAFAVHVINVSGHESPLSEKVKAHCDSWQNLAGYPPQFLAEAVRALKADILVVLAGHTGENEVTLLSQRSAPIQISYHDVASSRLSNADYWITDPVLHPMGSQEHFSEALIRLPCFYLHEAPPALPIPDLPDGPPRFVSYNALQKLTPATLRLWARVMAAVPEAELVLRYREMLDQPGVRAEMTTRLQAAGMPIERVRLAAGRLALEDHLASLGGMRVALDPLPFNGSTTTFEALWMGVPVVSLAGECFVGRVGACFLTAIGHPELLALSEDVYVETAASLVTDRNRLMDYRRGLRPALEASPVLDPVTYTVHLEAAYRTAWRWVCAGDHPAPLSVSEASA